MEQKEIQTQKDDFRSEAELPKEIYSALFIDWDNIYTRLQERGNEFANAFVENPEQWMKWLEGHFVRVLYGRNVKRRILIRNSYYNPDVYFKHTQAMSKVGLTPIACPAITEQGKTVADGKLIIDAMKTLDSEVYFNEYIIVSGDSDFTPLLIELRERGRKALILSIGAISAAYRAAAFWKIREDWFCEQALLDYDKSSE